MTVKSLDFVALRMFLNFLSVSSNACDKLALASKKIKFEWGEKETLINSNLINPVLCHVILTRPRSHFIGGLNDRRQNGMMSYSQ